FKVLPRNRSFTIERLGLGEQDQQARIARRGLERGLQHVDRAPRLAAPQQGRSKQLPQGDAGRIPSHCIAQALLCLLVRAYRVGDYSSQCGRGEVAGRGLQNLLDRIVGGGKILALEFQQSEQVIADRAVGRRLQHGGNVLARELELPLLHVQRGQIEVGGETFGAEGEPLLVIGKGCAEITCGPVEVALDQPGVDVGGVSGERAIDQGYGGGDIPLEQGEACLSQQRRSIFGSALQCFLERCGRFFEASEGKLRVAPKTEYLRLLRRVAVIARPRGIQKLLKFSLFEQCLGKERKQDLRIDLCFEGRAKMVLGCARVPVLHGDRAHYQASFTFLRFQLQDVIQHDDGGFEISFLLVLLRLQHHFVGIWRAAGDHQHARQERNDHPALAPYSHKRNGNPRCPGRGNVLTPERVALDGWIVNKPVKTAIDRRGQQPKAVTVLACEQGRDVRPRLCWCAPRAHHEQ